jgi:type III restriction enzyme
VPLPGAKVSFRGEAHTPFILDRELKKWFKQAKGQFQIFYKSGADHPGYQPDFVAETDAAIYIY